MYLSKEQLNAVSQRVVRAYEKLPSVRGKTIMSIDMETLVTDLLGLKIEYHRLTLDDAFLGLTVLGDLNITTFDNGIPEDVHIDGKTIFIDTSLLKDGANTGRRNFTLAHEASHQILSMLYPKAYQGAVLTRRVFRYAPMILARGGKQDWAEWQSNTLASYILLPEGLVRDRMRDFGLGDQIRLLNKVYAPGHYSAFCDMADTLGVSKTALSIRMSQMGLIKHNYFMRPYDLVNVYPDEDEAI